MCASCGCQPPVSMALAQPPRSKVELIKTGSNYLRGTLREELTAPSDHFSEEGYQVLKFHGLYQQDDRDQRQSRRKEGKDKSWFFMVRVKIPGGLLSAEQYLACDELVSQYANDTLRVTTRQDFQFHGVLKGNLKVAMRRINEALLTTLGACGDVERNLMCCPAPTKDRLSAQIQHYARLLSDHLLPKTRAYHEIWLNGEKAISSEPDQEPIYGKAYLPRKFKSGIAYNGDNCIDVYTQDIGLIADFNGEELRGFNILVGGGLGMTHGIATTFPRLASPIASVPPERLVETVETIVCIQRDHGDRANRKHARLKYLVEEWGVPRFKAEMERRLGYELAPARPLPGLDVDDHLGWHPQGDGRWFLGVCVENGRIRDSDGMQMKTAFRRLVQEFRPGLRLTPQQNVLFTDIAKEQRPAVEQLLRDHGVPLLEDLSNALRYAMACPALPTCGLAMSDAERALPAVIRALEKEIGRLGLQQERISVRMTGCPNGCARPYVGDIGFVGRTLHYYNVYLGGDFQGTRLNQLYAEMVHQDKLVELLVPLLAFYKEERQPGEGFGDFCHRVGMETLQQRFPPPAMVKPAGPAEETCGSHRRNFVKTLTSSRGTS